MGMHIRKGGKFMKLKKKSGLMGAVIALSAASLVSVGFASWVISQGDTKEVSGTIIADDVDNQVHQLTLTWVTDSTGATALGSNPQVIYGHPATMNIENAWLTNDSGASKEEALVFYLKVECTNVDNTVAISTVIENAPVVTSAGGGTVGTGDDAKTGYAGALADNLVQALPTASTEATNFDANGSFVYKIEFKWGSTFGNVNPYNYYNGLSSVTPAQKEAAAAALDNLNTYLTDATFALTVVAK